MTTVNLLQPLIELGFTELEAAVYQFLVAESPASGYRIAQALGKPVGNIYKTVESLEKKGAISTTEEQENRLVRAVPVDELLDRIEREFSANRDAVRATLTTAAEPASDDLVYTLHSPGQVYARVRAMLRRARDFAILTICPAPLAELRADIEAAGGRGIQIGVKSFEPVDVPGVRNVVDPRGMRAIENGPGQWLVLSLDGNEFLQALFSADGTELMQGFWSANTFLSWMFYTGISSDLLLAAVKNRAREAEDAETATIIESLSAFENPRSIGKRSLIQRYRAPQRINRRRIKRDEARGSETD